MSRLLCILLLGLIYVSTYTSEAKSMTKDLLRLVRLFEDIEFEDREDKNDDRSLDIDEIIIKAVQRQDPTCGCPADYYETEICTNTADSVCAACTVCPGQRYQVTPCASTADAVCTEEVRPLPSDNECLPVECIFPFLYRGELVNECTVFPEDPINFWCSTVEDFDNGPYAGENFLYCEC